MEAVVSSPRIIFSRILCLVGLLEIDSFSTVLSIRSSVIVGFLERGMEVSKMRAQDIQPVVYAYTSTNLTI